MMNSEKEGSADPAEKDRILFLCTGNSCRSQMAEGYARHHRSQCWEVYSAGTRPGKPDPRAIEVMREDGVDISRQVSKHIDDLPVRDFDCVVTLCSEAAENCPIPPEATVHIHRSFDDPPRLAAEEETEEAALEHYRRVRDDIKEFILSLRAIRQIV